MSTIDTKSQRRNLSDRIFIRIDDRFIHGQVTAAWIKKIGSLSVWVVNDKIASNPVLKQLQLTLAPPGIQVDVLNIKDAAEKLKNAEILGKTLILVEKPQDVLALLDMAEATVEFINLGQMGWKEGRVRVEKTLNIGGEDKKALLELLSRGIKLLYQQLPDFPPKPIDLGKKILELKL
ncbi:MAG: PTS sugar transporter subunit IIB [Desulfurococcales archaeon]|nr:PTS sugar transporter subunit IIB [Desulfurococcales archaeon]